MIDRHTDVRTSARYIAHALDDMRLLAAVVIASAVAELTQGENAHAQATDERRQETPARGAARQHQRR